MTITKKNFKAIAKIISEAEFLDTESKDDFVCEISKLFASENSVFDWSNFSEACYK